MIYKIEISNFLSLEEARTFIHWINKNRTKIPLINDYTIEIYDNQGNHRKKKKSNSYLLPRLMLKYNRRCTKCNIELKMMREIKNNPNYSIVPLKQQILHTNGKIYGIASVEHIQRVIDNGSNNMSNLTLLCASCNNNKSYKISDSLI